MKRRLSVSQIRQFLDCRWQWKRTRLELGEHELGGGKSDPMEIGSIVHAAIEAYLRHLIQTRQDFAPQDVPQVWQGFQAKYLLEYGDVIPLDLFGECKWLLERFAASYRLDVNAVWKTEAGLGMTWDGESCSDEDPKAGLIGYMDLVKVRDTWGEIEDWKTGRVLLPQRLMQDDLQTRTYAMLLGAANQMWLSPSFMLSYPNGYVWRCIRRQLRGAPGWPYIQ